LDGTILIALPGVPSEMEAIFEDTVAPLLKHASGGFTFYEINMYADNIMESTLAPLIDKVMHDNPGVYVKSHPRGEENKPHIEIHFSIKAKAAEKSGEKLQEAMAELSSLVEKSGGKAFSDKQSRNQA
jgi:molybdopterin-biosynthesis enzyme MoeA-like protein